jgi:hypothetical protein
MKIFPPIPTMDATKASSPAMAVMKLKVRISSKIT